MNLRKTILPLLICFSLILTSFGTVFAAETTQELQTDESGTYLIGTADELFAFAELAKTTAEADKAAGNTRTALSAKLTANINLNPGATFAYDHETGLVTVAKGEESCKMGSGMKETELGNFHPVYNGLCTLEQWNDKTKTQEQLDGFRNNLIEQMNEKVEALGLKKWTPIGTKYLPYIGYFDGNGHTIDGLYINDETVYYTGLFGVTGNFNTISGAYDYGEVKNITIGENSLIVGYRADTSGATGAIVGMTQFDKIINCTNYATVVGKGSGRLNLSNSGLLGGIVGYANNDVKNCTNHGAVVSCESAGGIVGNIMGNQYQQGNILSCANYGKVYAEAHSAEGYAGGIAVNSGVGSGTASGCGGNVESCVNYGYVEGYYAGGVIYRGSQNTQVKYCANRGEVAGTTFASGIITYINNGGFTMEGCFNAGTVKALPSEGNETVTKRVFPLVSSVYTTDSYTVKNCYNDETVCPSGNTLFRDGVTASASYGVTTEFFATGEPAYKMGSYDSKGWKQNIATPAEDGKTPETYPTTDGTRRVYENTHYCCHTDDTNKQAHKQVFYSNAYGNIIDEHTPNANGICTHCGKDVRKPIFLLDTIPEAKVGKSYSMTIRLSDSAPMVNGNIKATVSETDDTEFTFSKGLTGKAEYSYSSKYYYTISGIPTEARTLTFTLSATNENGTTKKTYTLKVNEADPLEIDTDAKLDNGTVGEGYYRTLLCYSTDLEKTWSIAKDSALPAGLTLAEDGTISGTPTTAGDFTFTIIVSAGGQNAEKTFTLKVFEEGGCKHNGMVKVSGTSATCKKDGIADYYHCNICGRDFSDEAGTTELYNKDDLKIASNHTDNDGDGKCDFCGRGIVFRKVTADSDIVYGGTYIFVTVIDGKYYALTIPPEGKSGREYEKFMILGEITANEKGEFTLITLEDNGVMMLTTGFCAPSGGDLDIVPRYGFSAVCGGVRYGLADYGSMNFYVESGGPAKYGYRITLNDSGAALIGSVEQEWWSKPETADNGLLRAFDMMHNGKNTKFMSFYAASNYNGEKGEYSGATITEAPIYLYRMTVEAQTSSGVTFITNDNNSNVGKGGFTELPDAIDLSNVNGVADAVDQTYVESLIGSTGTTETEVLAGVCAEIKAVGYEEDSSLKYSVTPKVTITDRSGHILYEGELPDDKLSGDPITVTLYTGRIYPAQIIHYKNDGTKEYFYDRWSEKVRNGAKSFEYENGFVTFTITDFSDIKILKTAEPEGRTVVSTVKGTSTSDFTPTYGAKAVQPKITVTEGTPAYFCIDNSNGFWRKKNDDGSSSTLKTDTPFTEGTYYFYCQVRIDGASGATHVLNKDGITVDVNGVSWEVSSATINDNYSYAWVSSPDYVVTAPLDTPLQFIHSASFDIGVNAVGVPITSINVTSGVTGGTAPYTFSKVSGPKWLSVSLDGIISGTPSATGENESLVVRVTDSKSTVADITISVGKTNVNPKDRTVISTVKGTSTGDFTPTYGAKAVQPKITVTEGTPAYFCIDNSNGFWRKKNDDGSSSTLEVTDTFEAGTYYFYCQVRIDGASGATHVLNKDGITVDVNGMNWLSSTATINDNFSYVSVSSPDYVVTESGVYTKNEINYSDGKLIATVLESGNYNLIFSGYNSDGRLIYIKTALQSLSVGKNTITVPTDVDISKVSKVFLWRSLNSMIPVCEPALIK